MSAPLLALMLFTATTAEPISSAPVQDQQRLIAAMIADAQSRTSLLSTTGAGYDGKTFMLASTDGNFRLNVGGQLQFRYTASFRNADDTVNSDEFQGGFSQPRTRLWFDGHILNPRLFYKVMFDVRPTGGEAFLQDALVGYRFDGGWTLRGGQGILAFTREWSMGDQRMATPERSVQAFMFGQLRSKFVDLKYQRDDAPVRVIATVSDGFRSAGTDYPDSPADVALTARADWLFAGTWAQVETEFRGPPGSELAGALGAAAHYELGPDTGISGNAQQQLFAWTTDIIAKGDGWSVMGAAVGYSITDESGVSGADFHDIGLMAQFGVHVCDTVELVGRYDIIIPDNDRALDDTFTTLTAGANWYIHGHAAKLQLAALWFLDDTEGTTAGNFAGAGARHPVNTAFGPLPSAEDDQVAVMVQFQLLF